MEKINRYVLVNNIDELKEDALWETEKSIRVSCMGIFHGLDKATFPQTFRYLDSYDNHWCGNYIPCDKTEMIQEIDMQIRRYKAEIKNCKKILDTLKNL